jgi:hypothetical protein
MAIKYWNIYLGLQSLNEFERLKWLISAATSRLMRVRRYRVEMGLMTSNRLELSWSAKKWPLQTLQDS